ncbi:hypothetical protein ACIQF6_23485 [Kitasatospora sp. NPDC092948]|uniref:hypothetical protein n=1 Tax=Kitasatospora sp. NPDC092948 TaxID=3364088 RepID=UPI0037F8E16F
MTDTLRWPAVAPEPVSPRRQLRLDGAATRPADRPVSRAGDDTGELWYSASVAGQIVAAGMSLSAPSLWLDGAGKPRCVAPVAEQLVAVGAPVAALSPFELACWVGEKIR